MARLDDLYLLLAIRTALNLQRKGVRLSRSLPSGTEMAWSELGIQGSYKSVCSQVSKMIEDLIHQSDI